VSSPLRKVRATVPADEPPGGRVPPADLDSEAAVLSACLLDGRACVDALRDILRPQHFYADANRRVYEAVIELSAEGKPVDVVMVAGRLRDSGKLAQVGGSPYLAQLSDATPAVTHAADHAKVIVEKARQRAVIAACQRFAAEGYGDVGDPHVWAQEAAQALAHVAGGTTTSAYQIEDAAAIFAPLAPLRYIIQAIDLCPGAPALWAGYGYSMKTLAAQAAAMTIASGSGRVWGCFTAQPGRVLHIDYEQGSRLTRERYQRLAVPRMLGPDDVADRLSLITMPDLPLDGPKAEAQLSRLVDGYSLVLIDSLRAAAPHIDENSSDARRPLDMLSRVSERTGAAFVVIHHARKPNAAQVGGAKMAIRGSGALFDACGSVLVFEGEKGQPTRVTHEKARASGVLTDDFQIDVSDIPDGANPRAGLLVTGQGAASRDEVSEEASRSRTVAKLGRIRSELEKLFAVTPELGGAEEIAAKVGRRAPDVRAVLKLMVADQQVRAVGSTRDRRHQWAGRE
jgi:hypothetical protein